MRGFWIVAFCCISMPVLADTGIKPVAGEKFISLSAERNLAKNKKPQIVAPARFMPLANKNKFMPIGRRAQGPATLPADEQPANPASAGLQKKASVSMTPEQANQILSIFAAND